MTEFKLWGLIYSPLDLHTRPLPQLLEATNDQDRNDHSLTFSYIHNWKWKPIMISIYHHELKKSSFIFIDINTEPKLQKLLSYIIKFIQQRETIQFTYCTHPFNCHNYSSLCESHVYFEICIQCMKGYMVEFQWYWTPTPPSFIYWSMDFQRWHYSWEY